MTNKGPEWCSKGRRPGEEVEHRAMTICKEFKDTHISNPLQGQLLCGKSDSFLAVGTPRGHSLRTALRRER